MASVLIILNRAWGGYYFLFWHRFQKSVGLNTNDHTYSKHTPEGDYVIFAADLPYLSRGKNLAISRIHVGNEEGSLDDGIYCNLVIWPKVMKMDQYGISLIEYKQGNIVDEHVYHFLVDKNHEIQEDVSQDCIDYYNANKEQIERVFRIAAETWGGLLD